MSDKNACGCGGQGKPKILYSCSGAANTGEMADRVARAVWARGGAGKSCMAAIGAGMDKYLETARESDNLVVDGCPVACGKKMFADRGLPFRHIVLTEHGVEKGKTPVDDAVVSRLAAVVSESFGI